MAAYVNPKALSVRNNFDVDANGYLINAESSATPAKTKSVTLKGIKPDTVTDGSNTGIYLSNSTAGKVINQLYGMIFSLNPTRNDAAADFNYI